MERQVDAGLVISELRNMISILQYDLAMERSINKTLEKELFNTVNKLKSYEEASREIEAQSIEQEQ